MTELNNFQRWIAASRLFTSAIQRRPVRGPIEKQFRAADPAPYDAVEMELIRADVSALKAEAIASGDWAKWLESQRPWILNDGSYPSNGDGYRRVGREIP